MTTGRDIRPSSDVSLEAERRGTRKPRSLQSLLWMESFRSQELPPLDGGLDKPPVFSTSITSEGTELYLVLMRVGSNHQILV